MNFLFSVIGGVLINILQTLIEIPLIWIGEVTIFLVSFGRHKPRWDFYCGDGGGDFAFLSEMSFWIGIVTVCVLGAAIKEIFFSAGI